MDTDQLPTNRQSLEKGRASRGIGADLESVRCSFMRGGSSRGGVFLEQELPVDPSECAEVLLACYGSPELRQIDEIGRADSLTSMAAAVGRSLRTDADVEYTFYQVGIDCSSVSTGGSCGNMLSAVGPFAILKGLVPPTEPVTTIRIGQLYFRRSKANQLLRCLRGHHG